MQQTLLQFPEIKLNRRDGHKLRGYFANTFGADSDLFHNHDQEGKNIFRYPKIQYKIVEGVPMMLGIGEGGELIVDRFLAIKEINIDGEAIELRQKNMKSEDFEVRMDGDLYGYRFVNPWLPLNQKNHAEYVELDAKKQKAKLQGILINNMISFFKSVGFQADERIMVHLDLEEARVAKFKNQPMLIFGGGFVSNVYLPNYIGLGKSVARGYGTILRKT